MTANGKNGRNGRNGKNGQRARQRLERGQQPPAPPPPQPPPPRPRAVAPLHPRLAAGDLPRRGRRPRRRGVHGRAGLQEQLLARVAAAGLDRPELVRLRGGQLRPRRHPRREEPPAGRARPDVPAPRAGDGRDRGPALLLALGHRLRGHRARGGQEPRERRDRPGRLDPHAAARPQPLHRQRGLLGAQDQGGLPGDQARGGGPAAALGRAARHRRRRAQALAQGEDPRDLPEPGVLRQPCLRGGGGCADVLLQAREEPRPRPGRD